MKTASQKLMGTLTGNQAAVDEKTMVIINGSEVLTDSGIKGRIHEVGVGFGTGRHGAARNRVPGEVQPVPPPPPIRKRSPKKTPEKKMRDAHTNPRMISYRN